MPYALLVDADQPTRAEQRTMLERDGWDVDERDDADAALATMRSRRPDVVLIALHPPRLGGLHLLQEMLIDDHLRTIPRIVISGGADPVERQFALKLGAAAWLSSPVSEQRLLAATWDHHSDATQRADVVVVPPRR